MWSFYRNWELADVGDWKATQPTETSTHAAPKERPPGAETETGEQPLHVQRFIW